MSKRIISLVLVFMLMMSSTLVFAADYDLKNKTTGETMAIDEVLYDSDLFYEVAFDQENYTIEFGDALYSLKEVQAKFDANPGMSLEDAVKGLEPVEKPEVPVEGLKVVEVSAINENEVLVKFNKAVEEVAAKNFSIKGLVIESVKLSEDKTEVRLSLKDAKLGKAYTLEVKGIEEEAIEHEFTMPKAEELYTVVVKFDSKEALLKADGIATVVTKVQLVDKEGEVLENAERVEVSFDTTFGNFAEKRVTAQNGVATNLLKSEALDSSKTAIVTAIILEAANKDLIGLKGESKITMTPNPEEGVKDTVGAKLIDAQTGMADRITLFFNKEVKIENYVLKNTHKINDEKAVVTVNTDANNAGKDGKVVTPMGLLPVPGNDRALYLILDTETPLTDNANTSVKFTDKTGTVNVEGDVLFKLTDSRRPSMLEVNPKGLNKLVIEFSEPVINKGKTLSSATNEKNWVINGVSLDATKWNGKAEVGEFVAETGVDKRNIVTITLGEGKYFEAGKYSIQGSGIGDWANLSDEGNNVMNTQTLDFSIEGNDIKPTAIVDVQSPEQYIVKFATEVSGKVKENIELQQYDEEGKKWNKVEATTSGSAIEVEQLENGEYKVELTEDWTEIHDTKGTFKNYYNYKYRLFIDKEVVTAVASGEKNQKIELALGGAMETPDTKSPVIDDIEEYGKVYHVLMSEPVKLPGDTLATLAQGQESIPQPTAQFIKKDGLKTITIDAEEIKVIVDDYDMVLEVAPSKTLEAGAWTLVVRSISDDVGNTAASVTRDFTVKGEIKPEDEFKVIAAYADVEEKTTSGSAIEYKFDNIFVEYSTPFAVTGNVESAIRTTNYSLNGANLPRGTQIQAIENKDDKTTIIRILLPKGYLNGINEPHVLVISGSVENKDGSKKLENAGAFKLEYNDTKELKTFIDGLKIVK